MKEGHNTAISRKMMGSTKTRITDPMDPPQVARALLDQILLEQDDNSRILILHHCKLTDKTIEIMNILRRELMQERNVDITIVKAPYNGDPATFSEQRKEQMKQLGQNVTYMTEWAFLPDKAFLRVSVSTSSWAKTSASDAAARELAFLPTLKSTPNTYGVNEILECWITMQEAAKLAPKNSDIRTLSKMSQVAALVIEHAGPMNGFSRHDIDRVSNWLTSTQAPNGSKDMSDSMMSVSDFIHRWVNFVQHPNNKPNHETLLSAVSGLSSALEATFPELKKMNKDKYGDTPYQTIRAAIDWEESFVKEWQADLMAAATKQPNNPTLPRYKRNKKGKPAFEVEMMDIEKASIKIPRAITKAIESLFAPFEHLALDGAAAYSRAMQLSNSRLETFFDKYVVIELHDMERDDVRAVNGFNSLRPPAGRYVAAVQVATGAKAEGDIPDLGLMQVDRFNDFILHRCTPCGQSVLPLFQDEEASNQEAVRKTIEIEIQHWE